MSGAFSQRNSLEKRKSQIHGLGVFTTRPVLKGEKIYTISLDNVVSKPRQHLAQIGPNKFVDDPILNSVNHSCNPVAKLVIELHSSYLLTLKDIPQDNEITCDYNETEIGGKEVRCTCGEKNCRKYFLSVQQD